MLYTLLYRTAVVPVRRRVIIIRTTDNVPRSRICRLPSRSSYVVKTIYSENQTFLCLLRLPLSSLVPVSIIIDDHSRFRASPATEQYQFVPRLYILRRDVKNHSDAYLNTTKAQQVLMLLYGKPR